MACDVWKEVVFPHAVIDGKAVKVLSKKTSVVCDTAMFRLINDSLSDTESSVKTQTKPDKEKRNTK